MRKSMQVTLSKICRINVYLFLFLREGTFFDPQNNVEKVIIKSNLFTLNMLSLILVGFKKFMTNL